VDALKGNDDKNDGECSISLQMLGKDGNTMDGECSPSLKMLKEVEIQWMGSALHHASHINSKKLLYRWGALPIAFAYVTKKTAL
jgi:hypothetical protein